MASTSPPREPTRQRDSPSPSPEFDPATFQASLDHSVNAARDLVSSWIPTDFGAGGAASSKSAASGTAAVQSLKDKARPPRMGLGAQPAAIHKQQAEDRRLKDRLLGRGRQSIGDDGAVVKGKPENPDDGASSESDDDEDSRSRAIGKGKAKSATAATNGVASTTEHAPNNPFVIPKSNPTPEKQASTPKKATKTAPPLFNDPSPVKASAAPSSSEPVESSKATSSSRTIAPVSFYKDTPAPASASSAAGLSKNQRKKLRKQEREAEIKQRMIEESRKEEESERKKLKRSRGDDDDERREEEDRESGEQDGDDVEMAETDIPAGSAGNVDTLDDGEDTVETKNSKKKKKKRKGKGGNNGPAEPAPLLNL
ncbi:hypothetical protein JCM10212_002592 [Sporobolomyces blumeae]